MGDSKISNKPANTELKNVSRSREALDGVAWLAIGVAGAGIAAILSPIARIRIARNISQRKRAAETDVSKPAD